MLQIEIRSAREQDRAAILAFCTHTWEWGDYIERALDTWFDTTTGQLLAATLDGVPVGIVHMEMLTPFDAWIEGLRVDPAYRHHGIARSLSEAAMAEAMRRNATHIRLAVHSENEASIRIWESLHMRAVSSFAIYTATPTTTAAHTAAIPTQLATLEDLDEIIDYLNASNIFPLTGGLHTHKFRSTPITAELLETLISQQNIYLLRRWERIDGLALTELYNEQGETRLSVGYVDGMTIEAISLIAYDLQYRLAKQGLAQARVYAPDLVLVHDALNGMGYQTEGDIFTIFERGLL